MEAVGGFPFVPYTKEGVPSLLSRGAFHQAVLSGLQKSLVAPLASGLNTHDLKRQVPTGSPLLRINQVRVPTLRGRALC